MKNDSKTYFPFLTRIYFTKGWTTTARHGVTQKKQRRNAYRKTDWKEPKVKMYLKTIKSSLSEQFRSLVKGMYSAEKKF